jgi:hypothetical protein
VPEFEAGLLDHMRTRHSEVGETIRESGNLEDDTAERLKQGVEEFKSSFTDRVETVETVAAEEGVPETGGTPAAEAGDAATQSPPADQARGNPNEQEGEGRS